MVFPRNVCRICEQLCQIDHSDSIAWMPSRGSLGYVLPQVIRLTLCLPSLPGLGRCVSRQPDHQGSSPRVQLDWWWGSQGLVAAAGGVWRITESIQIQWIYLIRSTICSRAGVGTLSRYETGAIAGLQQPHDWSWLIALGISFGLGMFLKQQSSAPTGSCCRPWSQQDHQRCWFVRWPADWWRKAGLLAGGEGGELQLGGPCCCPVH